MNKKITFSQIAKNKISLNPIWRHRKMNQYSTDNLEILVKRSIGLTGLILSTYRAKGFVGLMDVIPNVITFAIDTPTRIDSAEKEIRDLNTQEILKVTSVALESLQEHFEIADTKPTFGINKLSELVSQVITIIFDFTNDKNFTKEHILEILNIINFVVINEKELLSEVQDLDLFEGLNLANIIVKEIAVNRAL